MRRAWAGLVAGAVLTLSGCAGLPGVGGDPGDFGAWCRTQGGDVVRGDRTVEVTRWWIWRDTEHVPGAEYCDGMDGPVAWIARSDWAAYDPGLPARVAEADQPGWRVGVGFDPDRLWDGGPTRQGWVVVVLALATVGAAGYTVTGRRGATQTASTTAGQVEAGEAA